LLNFIQLDMAVRFPHPAAATAAAAAATATNTSAQVHSYKRAIVE
jgi:hypothetical protein